MFGSTPFHPDSPQALGLYHILVVVLVILAGIFLLVAALVFYASYRFRAKRGTGEPRQMFGNAKVEIAWTVGPILLLTFIFVMTVHAMHIADPSPGDRPADLVVIAHQWWWEAHYPHSGVVTANEIHIPVGKRLLVLLKSADVIHDFWVPQLGRKKDAIPGHPNHFWLQADKPGIYLGTCAEYCGAEHAWMRIRVVAQTPADFDAWTRQQLQVPPQPTGGDAAAGARFFQDNTCVNCHAVTGTAANGRVGPDLTHIMERATLASGRLENNPSNMARWLANPQAVKPGVHMPDFHLTKAQVKELVAYMETLK